MELLDIIRGGVKAVMRRIAGALNRLSGGKISPNGVTIVGLLGHVPIAYLIAVQHNLLAAGLLVFFGLFDTLDGELARLQKRESAVGMLLDSVSDRVKEVLLYCGIAYNIIAVTGRPYLVVWAVAACGASLLTSYVNAWGEVAIANSGLKNHKLNKSFRSGLMTFEVRMFVLFVAFLSNRLALAVIVITVLAGLTALSRLLQIMKRLSDV